MGAYPAMGCLMAGMTDMAGGFPANAFPLLFSLMAGGVFTALLLTLFYPPGFRYHSPFFLGYLLLAGAVLAALTMVWRLEEIPPLGLAGPASEAGAGVLFVLDAGRLAWMFMATVTALLVLLLCRLKRQKLSRLSAGLLMVSWALVLLAALMRIGWERAWICLLVALLLVLVMVQGVKWAKPGGRCFLAAAPPLAMGWLWCASETIGVGLAGFRMAAALAFLFALPLPGYLALWKKGSRPGLWMAGLLMPVLGLMLLASQAPVLWLALPMLMSALVMAMAACLTRHGRSYGFFLAMALLQQQGACVLFAGVDAAMSGILTAPLLLFGLLVLVPADKEAGFLVARRPVLLMPPWCKGLLALLMGLNLWGHAGRHAEAMASMLSWHNGHVLACCVLLVAVNMFLLLGLVRWWLQAASRPGEAVPVMVWCSLGALLCAWGAAVNLSWAGLGLLALSCLLMAAVVSGTPREEKTIRIFSGIPPGVEDGICRFTSLQWLVTVLSGLGRFCLGWDRCVPALLAAGRKGLAGLGRLVRLLEGHERAMLVCLMILSGWGMP